MDDSLDRRPELPSRMRCEALSGLPSFSPETFTDLDAGVPRAFAPPHVPPRNAGPNSSHGTDLALLLHHRSILTNSWLSRPSSVVRNRKHRCR